MKNLNPFMRADTLPFMNMMNPLMKPGMMPGSKAFIVLYLSFSVESSDSNHQHARNYAD
jgi:hypothetical protein